MMIRRLVKSAFQTGCLSVESEGLIRQVMAIRSCRSSDLAALEELYHAVNTGQIQRETRNEVKLLPLGDR